MRYRTGFVSNSSSSSFVVAFDKIPESAEELRQMLFGDAKMFEGFDVSIITKQCFEDMKDTLHGEEWGQNGPVEYNQPLSTKAILDFFQKGSLDGDPDYRIDDINDDDAWEARSRRLNKHRATLAMEFISSNKGKFIFGFNYSDNDGEMFSSMEHGGLFRRLPHVRFNEH